MNIRFSGAGIWAPGIASWQELLQVINNNTDLSTATATAPPAEIIPAREKRRVPMIARMAIEAGTQACRMAAVDPAKVATVFASCMGDVKVTDYMCSTLTTAAKAMSPTQFHNSVHNATCGYWSIFTGGRRSGGFACAYKDSFAAGLLEAATLVHAEQHPTLLVCYDVASVNPLHSSCPIDVDLAFALLLEPADSGNGKLAAVTLTANDAPVTPAPLYQNSGLLNPVANGLALLHALGAGTAASLAFKVGSGSLLRVQFANDA